VGFMSIYGVARSVWVVTDERYVRQRMPLAVVESLVSSGLDVRTLVVDDLVTSLGTRLDDPRIDPLHEVKPGDVVLGRTRNRFGLALMRQMERLGAISCNPWGGIAEVRNKPRAVETLVGNGIPVPRTFLADHPGALKDVPVGFFPLLLKPHLGDNGRGLLLVRDPADLDDIEWLDGMVLAQQFVDTGLIDLKLYGVTDRVWAVRRTSPLAGEAGNETDLVEVTAELRDLATACGRIFGLDLYGVDILESPTGPLVVDVNEFPNYTGIVEAPAAIATLVTDRVRGPEVSRCAS